MLGMRQSPPQILFHVQRALWKLLHRLVGLMRVIKGPLISAS